MNKQLTLGRIVMAPLRAGGRAILALVLLTLAFWRRLPSFYRRSLVATVAMIGICALGAWRQYSTSGRFDPLYAIIAIWVVSYVAYRCVAHRWQPRRRAKAAGTLAIDRLEANSIEYITGSLTTTAIWVTILFVAVLALAVYKALVA